MLFGRLAALDDAKPVLVACEGLAPCVKNILDDFANGALLALYPAGAAGAPVTLFRKDSARSAGQLAPPFGLLCSLPPPLAGWLFHLMRTRAGEHLIDVGTMQRAMLAITSLCNASEVLAVELFCGGVLGCSLGLAQQLVVAQPHADQESFAADMFLKDIMPMVRACGRAVPQARAQSLPTPVLLSPCRRRGER